MSPAPRAYKVGYARVSSPHQKLDAQFDALHQAGCNKIFSDYVSGSKADRPGWEQLRAYVRPGDTVVMTELSRMSRSLMHLLEVVREFAGRMLRNAYGLEHPPADAASRLDLRAHEALTRLLGELEGWRDLDGELSREDVMAAVERAQLRPRTGDDAGRVRPEKEPRNRA